MRVLASFNQTKFSQAGPSCENYYKGAHNLARCMRIYLYNYLALYDLHRLIISYFKLFRSFLMLNKFFSKLEIP